MMPSLIYKICPLPLWAEAKSAGVFAGSPDDVADGYIHFSTHDQLPQTAARHFSGQENLLLLTVAAHALDIHALRWEPSRDGQLFPHLYGPLPLAAVVEVAPIAVGEDGVHILPGSSQP